MICMCGIKGSFNPAELQYAALTTKIGESPGRNQECSHATFHRHNANLLSTPTKGAVLYNTISTVNREYVIQA